MTKEIFCSFYDRLDAESKRALLLGYRKIDISAVPPSRSSSKQAPENSELRLKAKMSSQKGS